MRRTAVLALNMVCLLLPVYVAGYTPHPLGDISDTAVRHVRANIAGAEDDVSITANRLDPRLALAKCNRELQAHLPYSSSRLSNTIVVVSCEGEHPWSLHVPVSVAIFREVAVASRPLARGTLLDAGDIDMQRMDISQLAGGYLNSAATAVGQLTTRPVQVGRPLLANQLKPPKIIRRGQTITVLARQSGFEVRSSGQSLMDGAVGERIRVKNSRSSRIVEGVIAANGTVFVD